ncbi:MAG: hypothetical protein KDB25_01505 [Leucobacter sp.]|nr:hypothetical protein [Leucobacter sp.]
MEISRTASGGLELLFAIAQTGPATTEALALEAGTSPDTCLRRLHTLAGRGYAVLRSDGTWGLGPKLLDLASSVPDRLTLAARDQVDTLAQRFAASVVIAIAAPPNFRIRLEREGRGGHVRVEHFSGVEFGIWQAPPGLALLPALDADGMAQVVEHAPDPRIIDAALDNLRRTGVVVAPSEVMTGRTGVAAPITLSDGTTVASITLAFSKLPPDSMDDTRARLLGAAKHVADRYEKITMGAPVRRSGTRGAAR